MRALSHEIVFNRFNGCSEQEKQNEKKRKPNAIVGSNWVSLWLNGFRSAYHLTLGDVNWANDFVGLCCRLWTIIHFLITALSSIWLDSQIKEFILALKAATCDQIILSDHFVTFLNNLTSTKSKWNSIYVINCYANSQSNSINHFFLFLSHSQNIGCANVTW